MVDLRDGKGKNWRRRIAFGDMGWEVIGRGMGGRHELGGKGMERELEVDEKGMKREW